MYYRSLFPRDLFAEFDRLQRELQQAFDPNQSIRGLTRGFPALNVGGTPKAVDIYAFAPGIDPATLEFADFTTEVCDGLPEFVEDRTLTSDTYCPWSARVISVEPLG